MNRFLPLVAMPLFLLSCQDMQNSEIKSLNLTVNVFNNAPDIWPENARHDITYCVSTDFGARYQQVVGAMDAALGDWESSGGFNYTHRPEFDANCHANNTQVTFDVRPIAGQDYLMRAFFPNEARQDRNILIDESSFNETEQAFIGFVRHEVGHTLGFRHEHIRVTGGCNENQEWEPVTDYDSASVMHYPHCLGGTGDFNNLVLTDQDRSGVAAIYPVRVYTAPEDEYLVGDFDGDGRDNLIVRRGNMLFYDKNFDGAHDGVQSYGNGQGETQYLIGDWNGDGRDNVAVRRGAVVYFDTNYDGAHDFTQHYGNPEDVYLVGDWDGDGRDSLAVRRGITIHYDNNYDGNADRVQSYGDPTGGYYTGDWNGDGISNIALHIDNRILFDNNFDGAHDFEQSYGNGGETYLIGDWDGDGRSNVAVRRGNTVLMDTNFDGAHDLQQAYGNGK